MGVFERCLFRSIYDSVNLNYPSEMKTGKWFIKPVLLGTIFFKFSGFLMGLQPESTVFYCFCAQDEHRRFSLVYHLSDPVKNHPRATDDVLG